jgi:uncharacterized SAM-binding protein YcdF (DUF218 family)
MNAVSPSEKRLSKIMRRRRIRQVLVPLCLMLIAALVAGIPAYVRPQVDTPRRADAILILGGPNYRRYTFGLDLAEQGFAPNVVVSNPNGADDPWLTRYCATPQAGFELHCFAPDPPTTKGEGRELRRLAAQHGWRTVIVVTLRPHISRARFILENCFDGELVMVAMPVQLPVYEWAFHYVYQTAGYVRAVLQHGC